MLKYEQGLQDLGAGSMRTLVREHTTAGLQDVLQGNGSGGLALWDRDMESDSFSDE